MAEPTMLTDHNGSPSTMRAMCFTSLIAGFACALGTLAFDANADAGMYLSTMFTVGAFAPKALQKFAEIKMP